ncbi:synaptotagmin-6-like [Asterias rubens]|uniref:synaptotagmin-6-like n=1 Tax=Asterias rubens TaxID=7604 RepID=UPI0014554450|nr:synaptotagmin-6-like [Asterias rubens]XP_033643987.1 synaptotagmin-6-like [Asterias rubens]XP_033643988.1 synaptotagmin-6-like [Asterias rubens]
MGIIAVLDMLCCCCEGWRRKLKNSESTTAIVQSPLKSPARSPARHHHKRSASTPSERSFHFLVTNPVGRTELRHVQPGTDPYYSEEDSPSSAEEVSKSSEDIRRNTLSAPPTPERIRKRSLESVRYSCELGQIQPELYVTEDTGKSKPLLISSGKKNKKDEEVAEEAYGTISIAIKYEQHRQRVTVHLYNVTDLPAKGQREGVDAVVHGCLLPDEKLNLKSKIIKDTLNPIFDDTMEFPVDPSKDFSLQALRLSVFDSENCSKICAIAHTIIPLTDCDMDGKQKEIKKKLQKKAEMVGDLGRLYLSLAYLPSQDRLSCFIVRARGLVPEKGTSQDNLETYVKVCLMCTSEKVKSRRTPSSRGTIDPVFTESLSYVLPMSFMEDSFLLIQVMQKGHNFKKDSVIGQLILGPYTYTQGRSLSHWGKMLSTREASKQWHALYL